MSIKKKLMLASLTTVMGLGSASAADLTENVALNGEIYGAIHSTTPGDDTTDYSKTNTVTHADLEVLAKLAEKDGWSANADISLELDSGTATVDEAFLTLSNGFVAIKAGRIDLGGVDLGNAYTTETGSSTTANYGNEDEANNYLAVGVTPVDGLELIAGLSARQDNVEGDTTVTTTAEGNVQVLDLVATFSKGNLQAGLEYETISYEENEINKPVAVKDSESALGLGVAYSIGEVTPFLNYGSKDNGTVVETAINLGVDAQIAGVGITVATEQLSSDVTGSVDVNHSYLSASYSIGDVALTGSYWTSDDKSEVASEIVIELALQF